MLDLLVLKNAVECTSQRLKWTCGVRVMTIFDLNKKCFMIFGRGTSVGGSRNQPERVPRGNRAGRSLWQVTDYFGTQLEPL